MNRILLVVLAALLILSIFVSCGPCRCYWAPIKDAYIWADESLPLQYFLYVVSGCFSCDAFSRYQVDYGGIRTISVDMLDCSCNLSCPPNRPPDSYVAQNVSFSKMMFQPGESYTVKVNNVTITFVAGGVTIYLAPIWDIEIWADNSLPPQYFVDVMSEELSFCDHFDSYNVTRAGNTTIIVEIFNVMCGTDCTPKYRNVAHTIPLGSDFVTGGNYTVVVNNVTETFVA
jgi:hypothetical protein